MLMASASLAIAALATCAMAPVLDLGGWIDGSARNDGAKELRVGRKREIMASSPSSLLGRRKLPRC